MKIQIKPLSVNQCWAGKRFKTPEYKQYEKDVLIQLPKLDIPKDVDLYLRLEIGFSNKASDLDNVAKPFIDILQKKYDFNDCRIYLLIITKYIVKKGKEYIEFDLNEYEL